MEDTTEIFATDPELAAGFQVRTLTYPAADYELAILSEGPRPRLERAVALVLDDCHRIKRRHGGRGYILERFDGLAWEAASQFDSLEDILAADLYRRYLSRREVEIREPLGDDVGQD